MRIVIDFISFIAGAGVVMAGFFFAFLAGAAGLLYFLYFVLSLFA